MVSKLCIVALVALACVMADETAKPEAEVNKFKYVEPTAEENVHLAEAFHDKQGFEDRWVLSKAKKDGVEDTISKYDGKWKVEEPKDNALEGDLALMLKSEAKHAAISSKLAKKFDFLNEPLIVQYEVKFHKAQECGGAYIKLLADSQKLNLDTFGDKTLYSIMFGPDKCGHDGKMHFILQHENPVSGKMVEHHAKAPTGEFNKIFDDKKVHLVTLIVRPGNTFEVLVDKTSINSGSLLKDLQPPINPEKEIDDPEDSKPEDWDEREKIPDPDAKKPDNWDEDAPKQIVDEKAVKPADWLDDEPEHVPDPDAVRPADWDTEEDGEWEAPLVPNPKCKDGNCGEWKAPSIANPAYKGKWVPPLISNPAYKGIWAPKKIPNPDFFENTNPFASLKSISAVGFELWSMQSDITFDNIILATDQSTVDKWTSQTWDLKNQKQGGAESSAKNVFDSVVQATEDKPWLWAIYILVILLPFVLIYTCCFPSKDKDAERKKTDEPSPDDEDDKVSNRSVESTDEEVLEDDDEVPNLMDDPDTTEDTKEEAAQEGPKADDQPKSEEPVIDDEESAPEVEAEDDLIEKEDSSKKNEESEGETPDAKEPEVISASPTPEPDEDEQDAAVEKPATVEEPAVNGHSDDSPAEASEVNVAAVEEDSPTPSPRATRSKRKSRKDT